MRGLQGTARRAWFNRTLFLNKLPLRFCRASPGPRRVSLRLSGFFSRTESAERCPQNPDVDWHRCLETRDTSYVIREPGHRHPPPTGRISPRGRYKIYTIYNHYSSNLLSGARSGATLWGFWLWAGHWQTAHTAHRPAHGRSAPGASDAVKLLGRSRDQHAHLRLGVARLHPGEVASP